MPRARPLVKRVYEKPEPSDGFRVLVDRLWPRGLTKEKAKIDLWLKDIAPSDELRKWFHQGSGSWPEFRKRYFHELKDRGEALTILRARLEQGPVTLVYSAKDEEQNNATALAEYLSAGKQTKSEPRS